MRKIIVVATALALAGCSTGTPTPAVTVTATPSPVPAPSAPAVVPDQPVPVPAPTAPVQPLPQPTSVAGNTQLFLQAYESKFGDLPSDGEAALVQLGYAVCTAADNGLSWDSIGNAIIDSTGFEPYQAGYIMGISIGALCPQYENSLESWVESQ